MKKISIIIVTYNSERTIKECLASILEYSSDPEIVVVDNGSKDQTLGIIESFGKQVKLISTGENLGFSKGNNLGVQKAVGEYLAFLNPDTRLLRPRTLEHLQELLEKNPGFGILGPKLIYPDGQTQARVRNLPTILRAFQEYILGMKGAYSFYEPKCQKLCKVESVIGACMVIKKDLFLKLGGFDEKYFMYYEDLALCKSAKGLGYKVGFAPDLVIEHTEGISGINQKTNQFMKISAKKYFGKTTFYLLELIFFYNRALNKVRAISGKPVF